MWRQAPTSLTFDLQLDPVQPAGVTAIHAPTAVRSLRVAWAEPRPGERR